MYVGILGERYGRQLTTGYSATHAEYLRAVAGDTRIAVWVVDGTAMQGHQQAFLHEIQTFYVTESVSTPDQLRQRVETRLRKIAAEDLAPWVKLGPIVFRANRIHDSDATITITGSIKDRNVAHAPTVLRPHWPAAMQTLQCTYADRSVEATVSDVSVTTIAGTGQTIMLTLQTAGRHSGGTMPLIDSYVEHGRTYTADDIVERQLRRVLFGDHVELPQHLAEDIDDPTGPLARAGVSEEIIRPLLRLLLIEAFAKTGRATHITELRVGPPTPRGRHLHLSWETRSQYGTTTHRTIDGTAAL